MGNSIRTERWSDEPAASHQQLGASTVGPCVAALLAAPAVQIHGVVHLDIDAKPTSQVNSAWLLNKCMVPLAMGCAIPSTSPNPTLLRRGTPGATASTTGGE